jgi:ribonuclease BN (tRNA processing enzyme)
MSSTAVSRAVQDVVMNVRVLGCSGGVNQDVATTSFLIDDDILIDAGSGVCYLSLEEMLRIRHVFITHSHLDHIAAIPLLADTLYDDLKRSPLRVYALPATLKALKDHIFNWVIWPDFTELPDKDNGVISLMAMHPGESVEVNGRDIGMVKVNHTVDGAAYIVSKAGKNFAFSGDTTTNDDFWQALNRLDSIDMLVVESAFSNEDANLAELSRHYCPMLLAEDLNKLEHDVTINISHLKPGYEDVIMQQCREAAPGRVFNQLQSNDQFIL